MFCRSKLLAGVAAAAVLAPGLALADPAVDARIAALEAQVKALSDALADLKKEAAAVQAPPLPASPPVIQLPAAPAPSDAKVSIANGRPTIASNDGAFTASFRGLLQVDAAAYDQRSAGPLASDFRRGSIGDAGENDHARDLSDGANFRRARLGIEGKAFGDFEYNFLYDFGGSGTEEPGKIINAWVQYNGLGKAKLRVGAFSAPGGLDDATTPANSLFTERASVSETVRGVAAGDGRASIALLANGERWNISAAVTGNSVTNLTFDEQLAFIGRAVFTPVKTGDAVVHLGLNAMTVASPAATGPGSAAATPLRLRDRPEIRVDGTRLIDTGSIDADGMRAFGAELGAQHGPLSAQAEYYDIEIDRKGPLANPHFSGWYVQGAWTLTGEPRRYNIGTATFDPLRPAHPFDPKKGQWGAWELAARYSRFDLNYREGAAGSAPAADAVRGGEQEILTVGVNWYLNSLLKLHAAIQDVSIDRLSPGGTAFGAGATPPAGAQIGQDFRVYSVRTQYSF